MEVAMPGRHLLLCFAAGLALSACNGGDFGDVIIGGAGSTDDGGFATGGGGAGGGGLVVGGGGFVADDDVDLVPDDGEGIVIGGEGEGGGGIVIGEGNDDAAPGRLDLAVTDAPVDDALAVFITFTGVEMQRSDGRRVRVDFESPRQLDVLLLTEGETALLLDDQLVPAGRYQWLRLLVEPDPTSFVDTTVGRFPLRFSGGVDSGLQFNGDFLVPSGGAADLVVDIDLRRGLVRSVDDEGFLLRPSLRLIDRDSSGSIAGTVSPALINDARCGSALQGREIGNVVSIFPGFDITPDDIDGDSGDPLTTADVRLDPITGEQRYLVGFLPPGAYTLAFSCQGALDDSLSDDRLLFTGTRNVLVTTSRTETVNF
jgi:hypothetical protein